MEPSRIDLGQVSDERGRQPPVASHELLHASDQRLVRELARRSTEEPSPVEQNRRPLASTTVHQCGALVARCVRVARLCARPAHGIRGEDLLPSPARKGQSS